MPIRYEDVMSLRNYGQRFAWSDRDVILYHIGIGMGRDPLDQSELAFVNEANEEASELKVVPTFASVAAWGASPGHIDTNPLLSVDGERTITFGKPLRSKGNIVVDADILGAYDKGPGKGAIIDRRFVIRDEQGDEVANIVATRFARGDGGFGGPPGPRREPHQVPSRTPDFSLDFVTDPNQALIYRLCGDRNPLHSDPAFAQRAGFERPILHGLCTYGITCRAVLQTYADFDPKAFRSHGARFSAPVYPGDTVTVDLWEDTRVVSFEARVKARKSTVIKNGKAVLA